MLVLTENNLYLCGAVESSIEGHSSNTKLPSDLDKLFQGSESLSKIQRYYNWEYREAK